MNDEVAWMLELQVPAGNAAAFRALAAEMVAATQAGEPGTLYYEWNLSADGTSCHVYERYVDSAAALTHAGNFAARYAERFMALVTPQRMVVYGAPSAELSEALAGLGPAYLQPAVGFHR